MTNSNQQFAKPWEQANTEGEAIPVPEDGVIPKPWEQGFNLNKLPSTIMKQQSSKALDPDKDGRKGKGLASFANGSAAQLQPRAERKRMGRKGAETRKRNKLIRESAATRMEEMGFDPLEVLVSVAKGEAMYEDHPFLPVLRKYLDEVDDVLRYLEGEGAYGLLDRLWVEAQGYLFDTYTPKEQRIKVATELMQYARPKLKQVEHIQESVDSGQAMPLTKTDVLLFKEWFDDNY